jgi:arginase family enzyme
VGRTLSIAALRCRTSDRTPGGARGAEALALALDPDSRLVGEFGDARITNFADDLRDSRACIERAGALVDEALGAGRFPVLTSSDCSICLATFPAVARRVEGVQVLWLDAHADSNTPETTISGFLGGMCLGAAVGHWDAGFDAALIPGDVLGCGIRQLDPGEPGPEVVDPAQVPYELNGQPVYVHLDLDVLDPEALPAQFAEPGGLTAEQLRTLLAELAEAAEIVGLEVTAFEHPTPENVELVASIVRAALP